MTKTNKLPDFLQPFLWSYDIKKLDKNKHKDLIIKNVLNLGTSEATNWLKKNYTKQEIKQAIKKSVKSEWSPKSINLWSFLYEVYPKETRF